MRQRRWLMVGAVFVALVLIAGASFSWIASSILLVPKHELGAGNLTVQAVGPSTITLQRTVDTLRPGVYGLDWSSGHAIVGRVQRRTSSTVTRALTARRGRVAAGDRVALDTDVYDGDPMQAAGLAFQTVDVPDPLGPMPAWLVPGAGATWVIFVHGIDGTRQGGLRYLSALHALDLPALLISYRNDAGAPPSADGLIHLGSTEWEDLQAAAAFALSHGAAHLVLFGASMGGAIVTRFMRQSTLAAHVTKLVLDAPALDWQSILDNQAARLHLPFMAGPVELAVQLRVGFDWGEMDEIAHAGSFHLPILLFQGSDDTLVPPSDSAAFARRAPGPVTFVSVAEAGHIQSWNVDPAAYDAHLRSFLTA
ncbi:MAG: alpha/beta hydrolase [Candidatus Dormiibacterota bacterium]